MRRASFQVEFSLTRRPIEAGLLELRAFLHDHLFSHVMPFWLKHAVDEGGGINTCLRDDGSLISRDKWLWSQWRALWVFSTLHAFDGHQQWLDLATDVFRFCCAHGWMEAEKGWALRVAHDGTVLDGYQSLYVSSFAIYGLAAYYRVTGFAEARTIACRTADALLDQLQRPHDRLPHAPYPIPPGARVHGIPMMNSFVLFELAQALNDDRYRAAAKDLAREVFSDFYRPDRRLLLERIAEDRSELPGLLGTAVVPGHVIEGMWFQMHMAAGSGDDAMTRKCCDLIRRHLEVGWDAQHGGIVLAIDANGNDEVGWAHADTKLWWPHTEALYALLLAYEKLREPWCLQWYARVHEYAFFRYPHPKGEWVQKLSRQGQPIADVVALPVKDPFHLPRALILSLQSLDRMLGGKA